MKLYIYKEVFDAAMDNLKLDSSDDSGLANICVFTKEEIFENCDADNEEVDVLELDTSLLVEYTASVEVNGRLIKKVKRNVKNNKNKGEHYEKSSCR